MSASAPLPDAPGRFRPLPLVGAVALALLVVGAGVRWYARDVALPRYCDDPEGAVGRVGRILTEPRPAADGPRKDYVVAARLLYLLPRGPDEPIPAYLARVRDEIAARCGGLAARAPPPSAPHRSPA